MKIGIDASRAFVAERTGTEEYSYQLIRHLVGIDTGKDKFVLYVKKRARVDFKLPDNFSLQELEGNFLWTQFSLSREMRRNKVDVLFVPSHTVPFMHPKKTVLTVHGIEYKNCPECYSLKDRLIMNLNAAMSLKWASQFITPSLATKNDLVKTYGIADDMIKVVHHGVEKRYQAVQNGKIKDEYFNILFIGRLEKRKNIVGIIEAFELFMKGLENDGPGRKVRLILAGKEGVGFGKIRDKIKTSFYSDCISLEGYVSQGRKEDLYRCADVFLFPSFCEGFGIPVLEAMGRGVPVICSDIPSLLEVTGEAALLVDPYDPKTIAAAMKRLYGDDSSRNKIINDGLNNVKRFDWGECAQKTLDIIRS